MPFFLPSSLPLNLRTLLSGKNSIHKLHNPLTSWQIRPHTWNSKNGFGEVCSSREERSTIHFWIGYQILLVSDTIETANWLCNLLSLYFYICESSANEPFSAKQEGFTSKKFDEVLYPCGQPFLKRPLSVSPYWIPLWLTGSFTHYLDFPSRYLLSKSGHRNTFKNTVTLLLWNHSTLVVEET